MSIYKIVIIRSPAMREITPIKLLKNHVFISLADLRDVGIMYGAMYIFILQSRCEIRDVRIKSPADYLDRETAHRGPKFDNELDIHFICISLLRVSFFCFPCVDVFHI